MSFPSTYYQHAASPRRYVYDWRGGALVGTRAAETRGLGADGDYLDITATARFHKELSGYPTSLTPGTGRSSILHSGPEQTKIYDGLGFFGSMSRNEKRLALLGGAGVVAYLAWKHFNKGRR